MTSSPAAASTTTTAKPMFQNGDLLAAQVITLEIMTLRRRAPMMTMSSVKVSEDHVDAVRCFDGGGFCNQPAETVRGQHHRAGHDCCRPVGTIR